MNKEILRIGLLLDNFQVPSWSYKMIENINNSNFADIKLVVLNDQQKVEKNITLLSKLIRNHDNLIDIVAKKLFSVMYTTLIQRHDHLPDSSKIVNCDFLLKSVPIIKAKTIRKKYSDYFCKDDIDAISKYNIDIFIRCGFRILRGDIIKSPKYGIWSYHHGDYLLNRGGPHCFWESMESWPEIGTILQILTEDLDNGKVLYKSFSCTDKMSLSASRCVCEWKSLSFITRKMKELYDYGESEFFEKVEKENSYPVFYSERLYVNPTNSELAKLTLRKIKEKLILLYENQFLLKQWILMFNLKNEFSSSLWRYKKIIPPKDRYWADPHVIYREGKYYIFIEEFLYNTKKGHISLITMNENGDYDEPVIVIDKPYHISYPFVFEYQGDYYMIPESISNETIQLYKCIEFPHQWKFQMNLMENIKAVDATVLYHKNKWWMFTNIIESDGASTWDELFLFHSTDLFTTNWQPHPLNPIVSDCKNARPAGKIFVEKGKLYRPSQNCSTRYGYGFNINEITLLDENNYDETLITRAKPNWDKRIIGTHTFNRCNALHIIDAIYKRRR